MKTPAFSTLRPCNFSEIFLPILCFFIMAFSAVPNSAMAQVPTPLVAVHVSELTQALETSGQWRYSSWHYSVAYQSLEETLRSDGTPFIVVSDSDIAAGSLLNSDGTPRYPILISLAAEAIADNEISPISNYVNAGGFVFVGSSAFTRNPDGTDRGDFALASEMGLHMANNSTLTSSNNWNWYVNEHFTKAVDHLLTSHIPNGTLVWRGPLTSEDIPWGVSPTHVLHGPHWAETVVAKGATVLAQGDSGPFLAVNNYGKGQFIYHGAMQPFLGLGMIDPTMYTYLIYRRAIEWAFQSFGASIVKVSPWLYPYDAALMVRHDFEADISLIDTLYSSAQYEHALGVLGDYYFCTGALRTYTGSDKTSILSNLKNAVSLYRATIGPHNGGLKNPMNPSLTPADQDYWHWGPDEILDQSPPGYANGKAYATSSILNSFNDVSGWLTGVDNGRPGCGAAGNCPRIWASPYMNSTRENSNDILAQLGAITMGEQKVGPFPHWTLSYNTPGKYYSPLSLPESDWFVGSDIPQALDMGHTVNSIGPAVDFYYNLGGLLNFYGHAPSNNGGLEQQYVTYSMSKPKIWSTNAVGLYDWWLSRSKVIISPAFTTSGSTYSVSASISGATSTDTALEVVLPQSGQNVSNMSVFLNGALASASDYRPTNYGLKVRVGTLVSNLMVQYSLAGTNAPPVAANDAYSVAANTTTTILAPGVLNNDSDPEGGTLTAQLYSAPSHGSLTLNSNGSFSYTPSSGYTGSDSFTYKAYDGTNYSNTATVTITVASTSVRLASLTLNPKSVVGGSTSQGTVTLSAPAPSGGLVVTLSSNSSGVTVPAKVTVAGGGSSATFTVNTSAVASTTSATISAVYAGVTTTATLTVNPQVLSILSTLLLNPTSVTGGTTSKGTVTLSGAAPAGGAVVSLSDNSSATSVPSTVTVPAGSTSASFTIRTVAVARSLTVTVSASYISVTKTATLTVNRQVNRH